MARGHTPKLIDFDGKSMTRKEWAAHLGITRSAFRIRLLRWPLEDALTIPALKDISRKPGPRLAWIEQAGGGSNTL